MNARKFVAECMGTALLVFFGAGVAALSFGFGMAGESLSAGVIATALTFGLIMLILAYGIGPVSGAHINPAVTMGFLASGRMGMVEATGYWLAQFAGGIVGAALLFWMFSFAPDYSVTTQGLGADGFGDSSLIGLGMGGAFIAEVVLTFVFVLIVLLVTRKAAAPNWAGLAIGLALATVHLMGVPLTGTSVNPARSLGPALFVGGTAMAQLWLFIVAPLIGAVIAAFVSRYLFPDKAVDTGPAA